MSKENRRWAKAREGRGTPQDRTRARAIQLGRWFLADGQRDPAQPDEGTPNTGDMVSCCTCRRQFEWPETGLVQCPATDCPAPEANP